MVPGHLEVERKYVPGPEYSLPDLRGVGGVAGVDEPVEHRLEATYLDTTDLRLARARVTLRRRTGGTDAGWHLKLPAAAGARQEVHAPLVARRTTPPKAVTDPVRGLLRGAPLLPVATLRTTRVVTLLRDDAGRVLAEVADDRVTGTTTGEDGATTVLTWRELEVELVDGDEELLTAVGAALTEAGAVPSDSPSKLARVLADRLPTPSGAGGESGGKKKRRKKGKGAPGPSAGEVVVAAVAAQLDALQQADVALRTGAPEGVHDVRVACRRLRSILAAFRPVLDREATEPVREELRWVGAQLSAARDGEVALTHLRALVDAQPPELVRGPVVARLQTAVVRDAETGRRRALRTLADRRYLAVLDALAALVADPPLTGRAEEPARPVLAAAVRRTGRRLAERIEAARAAEGDGGAALHDVRKAAKRVRYTAEVATPHLGEPAAALVAAMQEVQDALGAVQDTVATREECLRLARAAVGAGEDTWTWGRLHALEEARCAEAAAAFWRMEPRLRPAVRAVAKSA
ncbi:CYTH and CHAD domain-containing protein [Blastococcus sp. SYSU D00820]